MKKIILGAVIFGFALFIIPAKLQAQTPYYNYPPYIASQRAVAYAMANARYKRATRKKAKRKVVRRKTRRVSMIQQNEIKFKPETYPAKRADIV